jgi:hypothetical protein
MTSQNILMKFDPATCAEKPYPSHAAQYRDYHGKRAWLFNPWTGAARSAEDIGSDIFGSLIQAEEAQAAEKEATTAQATEKEEAEVPVVFWPHGLSPSLAGISGFKYLDRFYDAERRQQWTQDQVAAWETTENTAKVILQTALIEPVRYWLHDTENKNGSPGWKQGDHFYSIGFASCWSASDVKKYVPR